MTVPFTPVEALSWLILAGVATLVIVLVIFAILALIQLLKEITR